MNEFASSLQVAGKVCNLCPQRCYLDQLSDIPTVTGVLKGYDQLLNLVLDEVEEDFQGIQRKTFFLRRLFILYKQIQILALAH